MLLTTASAVVFIALVIAMLAGMLANPYAGLVVFVALPALFVLGLLLIPLGRAAAAAGAERAILRPSSIGRSLDFRRASVRRTALAITALTAVNVVIILLGGLRQPALDGVAVASAGRCATRRCTRSSPPGSAATHARIACVDCHIGEGAAGFVHAKLVGVRQLAHVVDQQVSAAHSARRRDARGRAGEDVRRRATSPARGSAIGSASSASMPTTKRTPRRRRCCRLHVGPGSTTSTRAIHWHANPAIRIEYVATDPSARRFRT